MAEENSMPLSSTSWQAGVPSGSRSATTLRLLMPRSPCESLRGRVGAEEAPDARHGPGHHVRWVAPVLELLGVGRERSDLAPDDRRGVENAARHDEHRSRARAPELPGDAEH